MFRELKECLLKVFRVKRTVIIPTECVDFLKQIKHYFSYLFYLYGFEVVHSESAKSGENCLIVLQSNNCRIKFYRTQGEVNLLFGTLLAQIGWENVVDGVRHWYYARSVMDFIEKKLLDVKELLQRIGGTVRTEDQQMAELSPRLKPLCNLVIQFFKEDTFEQRCQEYEKFEQEQNEEFRRQFEKIP